MITGALFSSISHAKTTCPVAECMSCGDDCLAYITTIQDESGQNQTWENGEPQQKLTIIGTGQMTDFSLTADTPSGNDYSSDAPWEPYWKTVKEIDVSGVENIGKAAFRHFRRATDVKIADSVTSIGDWAFDYLPNLQNFQISNNLQNIGLSFTYTPLYDFPIPESILFINGNAFAHANISSLYCSADKLDLCRQALKNSGFTDEQISNKLKSYENVGGQYLYNGKFYANPNDIVDKNNIKKRIYTVGEANLVSGKKNKVSIRYR